MSFTSDVKFTDAVKHAQRARGSRDAYARMERLRGGFEAQLTPEITAFIAERDSAIVFDVAAWDANCSQHIPHLIHAEAAEAKIVALRDRIRTLEALLRGAGIRS